MWVPSSAWPIRTWAMRLVDTVQAAGPASRSRSFSGRTRTLTLRRIEESFRLCVRKTGKSIDAGGGCGGEGGGQKAVMVRASCAVTG